MKLNEVVIQQTGTLGELAAFEQQQRQKNDSEQKCFDAAKLRLEQELAALHEKQRRELRYKRIFSACLILAVLIFILVMVIRNKHTGDTVLLTDTLKAAPLTTYYVRSRHCNVLTAETGGQLIVVLQRSTPVSVITIGPKYAMINYNGVTAFVRSGTLGLTPPAEIKQAVETATHMPPSSNEPAEDMSLPVTSADGKVYNSVFHDDFNSNEAGWPVGENNGVNCSFRNGYVMKNDGLPAAFLVVNTPLNVGVDNYIVATLVHLSGDPSQGYGIAFSYEDTGNNYDFEISGDGRYRICRFQDNIDYTLLPWSPSAQLHIGNDVPNRLMVWSRGVICYFYINGQLVNSIDNLLAAGTYAGFRVDGAQRVKAKGILMVQADH